MSDEADFTVKLIEQVSKPATKAAAGVDKLAEATDRAAKAGDKTTGQSRRQLRTIDQEVERLRRQQKQAEVTADARRQLGLKTRRETDAEARAVRRAAAATQKASASRQRERPLRTLDQEIERLKRQQQQLKVTTDARKRLGIVERAHGEGGGGFLSSVGGFVTGTLIARGIEAVAGLGIEAAKTAGQFLMLGQNAGLAFDQLTKHGVPGEHLFDHARALAVRFGLDIEDTTKSYQKFLALQFNPKQIDTMIRMGADLRALAGGDDEAVKGIFLAMSQIKSKGRLMAEEMMQLEERNVSGQLVWEEVGKLMGGKTVDQVRQLQQQGKITADIGLEAIERAVQRKLQEKELGEFGMKFADTTIGGMIGRVKALLQDSSLDLVKRVIGPATGVVGKMLDRLEGFLRSREGGEFIDKIARSLESAARAVDDFLGRDFSAESVEALLNEVGAKVQPVAVDLGIAIGKGIVSGVGIAIAGVGRKVIDEITPKGDFKSQLLAGGMSDAILFPDGTDAERSAGEKRGAALAEGARDELGIHSPSKVFARIGRQSAEGYAIGFDRGGEDWSQSRASWGSDPFVGPAFPALSAASAPITPALGGGMSIGDINLSVVVHAGDGASAQEIGEVGGDVMRRELDAYFRQLQMETG